MIHEPEKSDSVVVAVKPANKAEQSCAELVEPRTGTKGNANQQSTRRAQDRESVSQALERVRLAARRDKKAKFTSLLHHVDHEMLRTSFYALKRDAAPGVDGMTWETYEQGLDRRIGLPSTGDRPVSRGIHSAAAGMAISDSVDWALTPKSYIKSEACTMPANPGA